MNFPKFKFKGFWNDNEGLSVSDVSTLCILPLYLYVAIKYAIANDLSMTQVDFFNSLTYVILLAVGGKAIERFGFPNLRRNNNNYNGYNGYYSDYNDGYNNYNGYQQPSNNQNNIIINKTNTDNYENRV